MAGLLSRLFARRPEAPSDYPTRRRQAVADLGRGWRTYLEGLPPAERAMPGALTGFIPQGAMLVVSYYEDLGRRSLRPGQERMLPELLHEAIAASGTHSERELTVAWTALDLPGEYPPPEAPPALDAEPPAHPAPAP